MLTQSAVLCLKAAPVVAYSSPPSASIAAVSPFPPARSSGQQGLMSVHGLSHHVRMTPECSLLVPEPSVNVEALPKRSPFQPIWALKSLLQSFPPEPLLNSIHAFIPKTGKVHLPVVMPCTAPSCAPSSSPATCCTAPCCAATCGNQAMHAQPV